MKTRKLYYEDCHLREFTATVVSCEETPKGYQTVLDATAFYPEGGGQACDLGTLADAKVLDVREKGEQVVHLCNKPLTVGQQVQGCIDWDRRFDRMQQHTGEHILSGLIHARYGYHNVGFHMGKEAVEVDFDGPIPAEELAQLERLANEAVWANIPLQCWVPDPEELKQVTYRAKRELPWPVRIVQVPGYDSCACCGVHVASTGEVGLIKIISAVKFHQGVRLEMLCGGRAYAYMCRVFEENRQVSQCFSAKVLQTGEAARQMAQQLAQEKFQRAGLEKRVFAAIAQGYAGAGDVVHFEDGITPGAVRELADAIAAFCGGVAVVFTETDTGCSLCIISKQRDVKELGTALVKALNGRGGGKNGCFQGSVRADRESVLSFFRERG